MLARYEGPVHAHPPVIYESAVVSIREVNSSPFERAEYALEEASFVFVRCGVFAGSTGHGSFDLDANYVFLGRSGDYIYANSNACEACSCTVIRYTGATFAARALHEKLMLCTPSAYLMHARLLHALHAGSAAQVLDDAALSLICDVLSDTPESAAPGHDRAYLVCAIKEIVNQSLAKPVSLTALAKHFYLSPFAVSRAFHRETGMSLRRYTQRLRLRRALMLMLEDNTTLGNIASTLGFYDEPHFSKAFRAEFGIAPVRAFYNL
jgi:AraC-like DNA-binding protein